MPLGRVSVLVGFVAGWSLLLSMVCAWLFAFLAGSSLLLDEDVKVSRVDKFYAF